MLVLSFGLALALLLQVACADVEMQVYTEEMKKLARQLMWTQQYISEIVRTTGDSGLQQIRYNDEGTKPYHSPTAIGNSVCAAHDHPNYNDTLGLGELEAYLNGVWFRTRHNDFKCVMPCKTSSDFHCTEPIEPPSVPASVLAKKSVPEQVEEMKQYFKAFKEQDTSIRDYVPHFKPILCYLEGAWTTNTDKVQESFDSDRHWIEAESWEELQQQNIFTAASGRKNRLENYAVLPSKINYVGPEGVHLAQWNYRIICHPLKNDLPTNRLKPVDDLAPRMGFKRAFPEHVKSRAGRFQVNPFNDTKWVDGHEKYGFLDELMWEIPGKDNYIADLRDEAYGEKAYRMKPDESGKKVELNSGYYHRWYSDAKPGAMGLNVRHRGFEGGVFMAETSQEAIAPVTTNSCTSKGKNCKLITQRWSYAIPMEITYMTPLGKWNPYHIIHKPKGHPDEATVKAGGRNGKNSPAKAYNGTGKDTFAHTPAEFFSSLAGSDPADTSNGAVFVLDRNEEVRKVGSSGFRIFLGVQNVGTIRFRFPIPPLAQEGSAIWKELEAAKDTLLEPVKNNYIFREPIIFQRGPEPSEPPVGSKLFRYVQTAKNNHDHLLELDAQQLSELAGGETVATETWEADGHPHNVEIRYRTGSGKAKAYFVDRCDGRGFCGHLAKLKEG